MDRNNFVYEREYRKAARRASQRLVALHREEFDRLMNEERAKLGMPEYNGPMYLQREDNA